MLERTPEPAVGPITDTSALCSVTMNLQLGQDLTFCVGSMQNPGGWWAASDGT
jgi:hypothetical protein